MNCNEEFEFELSQPLAYQGATMEKKTSILMLKPPLDAHEEIVTKLQQGFARACLSMQKLISNPESSSQPKDDKQAFTGKEVIMALQASDVDYYAYKKSFYKLLCAGRAFVEENVKLTPDLLKEISLNDRERLLGEYIENFTLPSWMSLA